MENNSTVTQNELSSTTKPTNKEEYNDKNLISIWLNDNSSNDTNNLMKIFDDYNTIINNLKPFNNTDDCINYIKSLQSNMHLFVIISSHQNIIPHIHPLPQIRLIYILNENQTDDNIDYVEYIKVRDIFNDKKSLIDKLNNDIKLFSKRYSAAMTFFNNVDDNIKEKSLKNLSKENQYFMYMHLFIEILLRHSKSNKDKDDLSNECRKMYHDNKYELKRINEFQEQINSNTAIRWYTRDCFLYRLLNKALRFQDFDTIYKFRYIIYELYEQLKRLYLVQSSDLKKIETVYRGQYINKNELKNLQQNQGGLVSMNSFLSTTPDKTTASNFIPDMNDEEIVPVLFEININNTNDISTPYANIQEYSYMEDEQEILFSIDSVFRIDSVETCTTNNQIIHLIKLTIIQYEKENELKLLTDYIKEEIGYDDYDLSALGYLMMKMGHYDSAKHYCELLIENLPSNDSSIYVLYSNIGLIYQNQGNYAEALKCYEKTLNFQLKTLRENHPDIGKTYQDIAVVHRSQGNYTEALNYHKKALSIQLKSLPDNHPHIITTYNNIGLVYQSQSKYAEALSYFEKALNIQLKTLPENHPDIAKTYMNIGSIHRSQGNYAEALNYLEKTLNIQLKTLPENHPDIATAYNNIAAVHQSQGKYTAVLLYLKKALHIQLKSLPENHPDIGNTYHSIGGVYHTNWKYAKALNYYEKALNIQLKSLSKNHPDIAKTFLNLGLVHRSQGNYAEALNYSGKALHIQLKSLPENHPDIAKTFLNLGLVHRSQGNYAEALNYSEKALNIQLKSLPENHPDIGQTYNSIAVIHHSQGNDAEANKYIMKAVPIQSKHLAESHPSLAVIYNNIEAFYHQEQGNYAEALYHLEKTLNNQLEYLPVNHPDMAKTFINIGSVHQTQGNYTEALNNYEKALNIQLKSLPENNPDIAKTYWNIGNLYSCQGDESKAFEEWQKALNIASKSLSSDDQLIIDLSKKLSAVQE